MDIIVNAIPLTGLLTGISRYVRCLYSALQTGLDLSITYFTGSAQLSAMPQQAEPHAWSKGTEMIWRLPDAVVTGIRSVNQLNFERRLRRACHNKQYTIYHETAFFPAALSEVPIVYTLYDISLIKYRAEHPRERIWFFDLFFNRRLRYAAHILTISNFMRNELVETLKIPGDAVTAIPLAHDPNFYPRSRQDIVRMLSRKKWPKEYILFVGTLEPRKNLSLLIKALSRTENKIPLVLTGWRGWGDKQWLNDIKHLGLEKRVFFTDYVDEETLACLYSGASAFVYPSLYEGFGLPVLEAMACGCPVICSHAASLPEVAGDAALFINPADPDDLACKIDRVLQDTALRSVLIENGLQRAQCFSWQKTAAQTLELFSRVSEEAGTL
jgi:glycosyltransferase involved in cell wall biosynthesis